MSRCSELRPPSRRLLTSLGLLLVGTVVCQPALAAAEPTAPVADVVAPVVNLVAPVIDIQFGESDLNRQARVETSPKRTKITLDSTVLFAKDSAKINAKANARLHEVGRQLNGQGPGLVTVTGYTDDLGTAAHGKTLSRQRANAVAKVLRLDLPAGDFPFTLVGKGEDDPAVPNTSEANRSINRRAIVIYQKR